MKFWMMVISLVSVAGVWHFKTIADDRERALQKVEGDYRSTKAQLEQLKIEFEAFKTQRRNAMIGRKYPLLELTDGTRFLDVEIKNIDGVICQVMHQAGVARLQIQQIKDDSLKWEAVWTKAEASEELEALNMRNVAAAKRHAEEADAIRAKTLQSEENARRKHQQEVKQRHRRAIDTELGEIEVRLDGLNREYNTVSMRSSPPDSLSVPGEYVTTVRSRINASGPVLTRLTLEIEKLENRKNQLLSAKETLEAEGVTTAN